MRLLLPALLLLGIDLPANAQTDLDVWHAAGQTWLVWRDDQTFSGSESWSVYRSSSPITALTGAELIARTYPQETGAIRLRNATPDATWIVPDASGTGTLTLALDEALFVYTPRVATPEYFAVVKTGNSLLLAGNTFGPVTQTLDPAVPHVQLAGVDGGNPFTVYALWTDGDEDEAAGRADFPVLGPASFRGVARIFGVFEPTSGLPLAPMPAVLFLHGSGGNFWNFRPSTGADHQIALAVEDGLYVTFDDRYYGRVPSLEPDATMDMSSRWLGFCRRYDRFASIDLLPPADEVVVDYTPRWIDWTSDWLVAERGVDAERISLMGLSRGGRGVEMYARLRPERVAAVTAFVMAADLELPAEQSATIGTTAQNLTLSVPGGFGVIDLLDPTTRVSEVDLPFMRFIDGTNDTQALWNLRPPIYAAIDADRWGTAIYWDEREHTAGNGGWSSAYFVGSQNHAAQPLTRERRDRSFPAFHGVDHAVSVAGTQPDPGDAVLPANGNPFGTWGGWFDWDRDTVSDTPARWGATLELVRSAAFPADNSPSDFAHASVTIRRAQAFQPAPGTRVLWTLRLASSGVPLSSGATTVGMDGLVTLTALPFGPEPVRLEVFTRRAKRR